MASTSLRAGRIGPNAILQTVHVLRAALGEARCMALMASSGLTHHMAQPPQGLVRESEVAALHQAMRQVLGVATARELGARAGCATADYLLAHRIPRPMRWLLPRLPQAWSAHLLLAAVSRHAWTFCGSGQFSVHMGRERHSLRLCLTASATSQGSIADEPLCDYFAATFERLFRVLVSPRTTVLETACMAMGAPACEFTVRW